MNMEQDEKKARQAEILAKARAAAKAKRLARKLAAETAVPIEPVSPEERSELVQVSTDPSGSGAHAIAMSQGAFMQRDISEVPTGKTIKVQRAAGYKVVGHRDDGREIIKPVFRCRRRRPSSLDNGGISGLFSSGGPSVRFLTRYDGEVSEPLVGRQGSRVSMRMARGSASLLSSHSRGIWPRDVLKKVSRGLSRVEAGHPG